MFKGTSASAGIGIGKAVIVEEAELVITRNEVADAEAEIQRFKGALEKTIAATQKMADDLASRVGEKEAEIMQGHMMLLSDPMLTGEIENSVKNDKVNCEFAIENVCNMYADMFASMGDELMQQRATDMRDIKVRMQRTLMGLESVDVSLLPKGSILVAKDLTPSMTAGINPENVSGIVTELGGKTSHSAILARALEIPAVVAVNGLMDAVKDGDKVTKGELLAVVTGDIKVLLCGERTALNYLQRMSGIATYTNEVAQCLEGTGIKLLDTRKTTPNNRLFEKYAVRVGGGNNHRYNLTDGVLLKDNHIGAAGGVAKAVRMAKEYAPFVRKIEIEVENLDMVREAVEAGADIIMLDNMSHDTMKEALNIIDGRAEVEISGNITKENLEKLSGLSVDYVSSGALTHSAPIMDISLKNLHPIE